MHTPIQSDDGDVFGEAAKCPTFFIFIIMFVSCGQIDKLRSKQLKLLLQSPKKEPNKMHLQAIFFYICRIIWMNAALLLALTLASTHLQTVVICGSLLK